MKIDYEIARKSVIFDVTLPVVIVVVVVVLSSTLFVMITVIRSFRVRFGLENIRLLQHFMARFVSQILSVLGESFLILITIVVVVCVFRKAPSCCFVRRCRILFVWRIVCLVPHSRA